NRRRFGKRTATPQCVSWRVVAPARRFSGRKRSHQDAQTTKNSVCGTRTMERAALLVVLVVGTSSALQFAGTSGEASDIPESDLVRPFVGAPALAGIGSAAAGHEVVDVGGAGDGD